MNQDSIQNCYVKPGPNKKNPTKSTIERIQCTLYTVQYTVLGWSVFFIIKDGYLVSCAKLLYSRTPIPKYSIEMLFLCNLEQSLRKCWLLPWNKHIILFCKKRFGNPKGHVCLFWFFLKLKMYRNITKICFSFDEVKNQFAHLGPFTKKVILNFLLGDFLEVKRRYLQIFRKKH